MAGKLRKRAGLVRNEVCSGYFMALSWLASMVGVIGVPGFEPVVGEAEGYRLNIGAVEVTVGLLGVDSGVTSSFLPGPRPRFLAAVALARAC